jgi:hypothetical protein
MKYGIIIAEGESTYILDSHNKVECHPFYGRRVEVERAVLITEDLKKAEDLANKLHELKQEEAAEDIALKEKYDSKRVAAIMVFKVNNQ